jgi:hypothetical protein
VVSTATSETSERPTNHPGCIRLKSNDVAAEVQFSHLIPWRVVEKGLNFALLLFCSFALLLNSIYDAIIAPRSLLQGSLKYFITKVEQTEILSGYTNHWTSNRVEVACNLFIGNQQTPTQSFSFVLHLDGTRKAGFYFYFYFQFA